MVETRTHSAVFVMWMDVSKKKFKKVVDDPNLLDLDPNHQRFQRIANIYYRSILNFIVFIDIKIKNRTLN